MSVSWWGSGRRGRSKGRRGRGPRRPKARRHVLSSFIVGSSGRNEPRLCAVFCHASSTYDNTLGTTRVRINSNDPPRADHLLPSQPALVSLFSSTASHPTILAAQCVASDDLTADSFVSLLPDDPTSSNVDEVVLAWNGTVGSSRTMLEDVPRTNLRSRVLHLQGPSVLKTYIAFSDLGIKLPYLHFAIKDLGKDVMVRIRVKDWRGEGLDVVVGTFIVRLLSSSSPPVPFLTKIE
jgi:hypothetical protein